MCRPTTRSHVAGFGEGEGTTVAARGRSLVRADESASVLVRNGRDAATHVGLHLERLRGNGTTETVRIWEATVDRRGGDDVATVTGFVTAPGHYRLTVRTRECDPVTYGWLAETAGDGLAVRLGCDDRVRVREQRAGEFDPCANGHDRCANGRHG